MDTHRDRGLEPDSEGKTTRCRGNTPPPATTPTDAAAPSFSPTSPWDTVFSSLLTVIAFALPSYAVAVAALKAYREGDTSTLSFAAPAFVLLITLFLAVRAVERTPREDSVKRRRLVGVVWAFSALLQYCFTRRVAEILPPKAAVGAWFLAVVTIVAGFWICFGKRDEHGAQYSGIN